jgi:hypothetical protein
MHQGKPDDIEQIAILQARIRFLEEQLARCESPTDSRLSEWLDGPQRELSSEEIDMAVERLLPVCAEQGVKAVLREVCTCRGLLLALADACHKRGLRSAGQYLDYLATPYPYD